jgi:hypothetical protein
MSIAALVRDLAAAGATPEAIAIAVEAVEAMQNREAERKAKRAKAKAEERDRKRLSRDKVATVARHVPDNPATPPTLNDPLPNLDRTEVSLNPPPYSPPAIENSDLGFGGFWSAYPKRSGTNSRKNAETRFRAAVKSGSDPETIIDGARRYAEHCDATGKTNTEFVKAAEAWLNGRLWESSYSITAARPPPGRQAQNRRSLIDALHRTIPDEPEPQPSAYLRIAG